MYFCQHNFFLLLEQLFELWYIFFMDNYTGNLMKIPVFTSSIRINDLVVVSIL